MTLTQPRRLMLLTALVSSVGALWVAPAALAGDGLALAVLAGQVALAAFAVGFVCHGFLTDAIIARCRRLTEQHHALAAATLADWRRRGDGLIAALEADLAAERRARADLASRLASTAPSSAGEEPPPCRSASSTTSS
jgi:hypothetical protein